ncbi:MAG: prepilin-type N-terminal cleavage/methylation domain-containing protein, partial [Planctomycetota bacterium]
MRRTLTPLSPSLRRPVRTRVPYGRQWQRQAGFSLLETMIAAIILAILLVSLMVVLVRGQDTFDTLAVRAATQMRIQGT